MKPTMKIAATCILWALATVSFAQPSSVLPPQNVVQLSASATLEVPHDWLALAMSISRDGTDAQVVQAQLKTALDAALTEARASAQPGALQVRTGNFTLTPRRNRDGHINGWQGSAELLLEGRDFARISAAAGRIQTLTVTSAAFSLSREQQAAVESQVQAQAIERFKLRAADIAKAFGFGSYSLREVTVSSSEPNLPRPRFLAMTASNASMDAALPVEAGKGVVQVTVSGAVQLK
ncbi:MAG: SIMPL domain-containing protein [Burkholderiales bacterium]|nr:SIMPL domain-containing protein [Burkholderiales bacterium]